MGGGGGVTSLVRGRDQHTECGDGGGREGRSGLGCGHLVEGADLRLPGRNLLGGHVTAGMFGQVVAAHEAPVTHRADKLLLSCVCPPVTRQLVGASKLLVTTFPAAAEGLLTWQRPKQWENMF